MIEAQEPSPLEIHQAKMGHKYCWMHGFWVKVGHSSTTCSFPREGHCKDDTLANMKDGSNLGQGGPKPPTCQGMPADSNELKVAYIFN